MTDPELATAPVTGVTLTEEPQTDECCLLEELSAAEALARGALKDRAAYKATCLGIASPPPRRP